MPLSEDERRRLEELERDLEADDPVLAEELQSGSLRRSSRTYTFFGFLAAAAGLLFIIIGIATQVIVIGIIGFLLMGAGAYVILDQRGFGRRLR